jgi:hypothetical protein
LSERELYPPIKAFLEAQGYEVKGEVEQCDVVAVRGDEPPVVVELKEALSFALVLQAVDRLSLSDHVYIAFRVGKKHSSTWRARQRPVIALLRRLGLGLLTVSTRDKVVPVLDPGTYRPRGSVTRQHRLLKEFFERVGDTEVGGSAVGQRLTAYRQDALRCVRHLREVDVSKVSQIRTATGVERVGNIVRDNHYGWFERASRGHYRLTPKGVAAAEEWAEAITRLG